MEFLRKNFTLAIFTVFVFGIIALILVYLRLVLKIIIQWGNLWQRLQPLDPADFDVRTILQRAQTAGLKAPFPVYNRHSDSGSGFNRSSAV